MIPKIRIISSKILCLMVMGYINCMHAHAKSCFHYIGVIVMMQAYHWRRWWAIILILFLGFIKEEMTAKFTTPLMCNKIISGLMHLEPCQRCYLIYFFLYFWACNWWRWPLLGIFPRTLVEMSEDLKIFHGHTSTKLFVYDIQGLQKSFSACLLLFYGVMVAWDWIALSETVYT